MGLKFKSKKSAAKRLKGTGSGKITVKKQSGRSHLMGSKSTKRKRNLRSLPLSSRLSARFPGGSCTKANGTRCLPQRVPFGPEHPA